MTPISKELLKQIEGEAEAFKKEPHYTNGSSLSSGPQIYLKRGYTAGATAYAHYKERCEELERWKREADVLLSPLLEYGQSKEANIPWGASITAVILDRAKKAQQMAEALENAQRCIKWMSANMLVLQGASESEEKFLVNTNLSDIAKALASWKEEGKEGGQ